MRAPLLRYSLLALVCGTLAACGKSDTQSAAQSGGAAGAPPEVTVVIAHPRSVPQTRELVGRLAATRVADVRARVAGIVLERAYDEGTDVEKGQVLFRIDPAPLRAQVNARKAALARAEADAANAVLVAKRYREMHAKHLVSQQDLDNALATKRTTSAAVDQAQADLDSAELDLGYATVSAPIAGRAGRALVTEGALVGEGEATRLTEVEQIDPIYVDFSLSVNDFGGAVDPASVDKTVEIVLPGGTAYAHTGSVDFSDQAVDPVTGTVSLRAVVPNPERRLLPGMFVGLRLTTGRIENAFVLPQSTVSRGNQGAYVLVVNADGKVEQRAVQTHGMTRSDWIVTGMLHDGDQVISEGLQKVRPGAPAKAVSDGGDKAAG